MVSELDADKDESVAQAAFIAKKICDALAEPYKLKVHKNGFPLTSLEHRCTSSIGVALFFGQKKSEEELIKQADRAMYRAKQGGRNTIRFHDSNNLNLESSSR